MSSSAQQQAPGHSTCRVGLLLTLPNGLEADFWSAPGTRAALRCIDIVACSLPFINLVLIASRRIKHNLPSGLIVPLGAKLLLGGCMFISLVTLVLALTHPAAYKEHRMSLTKLGRCWRLMSGFLWTHPGTVIGYATQTAAVGNAALSGHISKALAVSVCAPTAMELQHCNLHLPFRFMLPFQLANFALSIIWTKGIPCWFSPEHAASPAPAGVCKSGGHVCSQLFGANLVSAAAATFNKSSSSSSAGAGAGAGVASIPAAAVEAAVAVQHAAEAACAKLHMLGLLLALLKPIPASLLRADPRPALCQGGSSVQVLYLFTAALVLLVLPLTIYYALEWYANVRWLHARGLRMVGTPWVFPAIVDVGLRPDSSEAEASRQVGPRGAGAGAGAAVFHRGRRLVVQTSWQHAVPLLLLLVLQVPWVVAEVLAAGMGGACAPVLARPRLAWMQGMW